MRGGDCPVNYQDHEDRLGVFVRLWTIDLLDGDFHAALLFNQLLWWHRPNLDGTSKLRYERNGYRWLLRADDGWWDECRMTTKQVRRVRAVLVGLGLVEHRRFKLNGAPTSAWRPLHDAIHAIRPKPELPSEGQFHGSDPQGAVGSDPGGAVPIPLSSRDLEIGSTRKTSCVVDVFNAWKLSTERTSATQLDAKRSRLISAALKAYPLADVLDAVRGWENDPFHRGENAASKSYNDLSLLLRDADHIEKFRDLARGPRLTSRAGLSTNGYQAEAIITDRTGQSGVLSLEDL